MKRYNSPAILFQQADGPIVFIEDVQQLARECLPLVEHVIDGGCDHSVGLCVCADIRLRDKLRAIIGEATAPETSAEHFMPTACIHGHPIAGNAGQCLQCIDLLRSST